MPKNADDLLPEDPLAWARIKTGTPSSLDSSYTVWQAVQDNNLPGLKSLIADGNSVDERNDAGATPLHLCATLGHVCLESFLITAGADVNARDEESHWTPMHRAICKPCLGDLHQKIPNKPINTINTTVPEAPASRAVIYRYQYQGSTIVLLSFQIY